MRLPLEWLKEFVPVRLAPKALAERLTMAGLEVVEVLDVGGGPVLELEITPNRPDCLSIVGLAREVAAVTGQRLKLPRPRVKPPRQHTAHRTQHTDRVNIRMQDTQGCRRYIGRLLDGVTVGPSPAWMQRRLLACGARPINNVVDITNYVLLERGQPLHAFAFDRLAGGTIVVRRARAGERITTLDGIARTLSPETLAIADAEQPVAIAGVMGGVGSEVSEGTKRVLLESALFDPVTVRRTARRLGLATDSSYRFERGVDPVGVETASARAAALIAELAGGIERAIGDVGERPSTRRVIAVDGLRLNRWLGTALPPTTIRTTLAKLSCRVASVGSRGAMRVSVPSFRRDLTQAVDLYEEVARLIGYERIPATLPTAPVAGGPSEATAGYRQTQSLRCLCASLGLTETIAWALVSEAELARCGLRAAQPARRAEGGAGGAVRLANPLSQDYAFVRPSLLVGLLRTVRRNLAQGLDSVRIFELGHVLGPDGTERQSLGLALCGWWVRDWQHREPGGFFHLKGIIETLAQRTGGCAVAFAAEGPAWAEPGQAATVRCGGQAIGMIGQLARRVAAAWDLETDVWCAELSVEGLLAPAPQRTIRPPAAFPPVKRDLSVLVSDDVPCEALARAVRDVGGPLAGTVWLSDRYVGSQVPAGQHSLTFSIEYRDPGRTLTSEEVDALHRRIGEALVQRFGAHLR